MCGIAGFLGVAPQLDFPAVAMRMADTLRHRGPDDGGVWADAEAGIALAHRRLAILDLSPAGHQPMRSVSGRYVLVFNGEIYNHLELRDSLRDQVADWRGHSDTETLLAAIDAWGHAQALRRCVGMFALALWDRVGRTLTLARDRLGEKPLYYGWQGEVFLFGSELKALRAWPGFSAPVDRDALALYLRHGYIPAPRSIYSGIRKLPAGTCLSVPLGVTPELAEPVVYWSLRETATAGRFDPFVGTAVEAVDELERLLRGTIRGQMQADVPLGAFLSGGIDSSTVVALMQMESSRPVQTFTIGFHETGYDEAVYAKDVAAHLGTQHTTLYVTPRETLEVIPRLATLYDEPFADSTQIPNFLLAQLARRHVTVSLSGDGGDELFAGYGRYFVARALWNRFGGLPLSLRMSLARVARCVPVPVWETLLRTVAPLLPMKLRDHRTEERIEHLAKLLSSRDFMALYLHLLSHWDQPEQIVIGGTVPAAAYPENLVAGYEDRMMFLDQSGYLPDDILTKVDRAAMGVSLETRVPMLDHRLVEFSWRLPLDMKIRDGHGKWLLRQVLYRHVPKQLIDRPKMGFSVPIDIWLRGPLRDWAEALLDPARLGREGYFEPMPIRRKWEEHLTGRRNWSYYLWDVLMFQAWLGAQRG